MTRNDEPPSALRSRLGPLRGVLPGAAAGALTGLLDAGRALGSPNDLVQPQDAFGVVAAYAVAGVPAGIVAALVARRFAWPNRMLNLLVGVGAVAFFVGAWANVSLLPGFTAPLSIFVDLVLFGVAVALVGVRYRSPGEDAPFTLRWTSLLLSSAGIALVLGIVLPGRDDGALPEARGPFEEDGGPAVRNGAPNVLVYLVDTLRADHLGSYGYPKPTSPEFDAFARDATVFEDCRATTSWTKPSVASLLTSLYPSAHSCIEQREVLVPEAETLPEVLRAAGWETAAFVDNPFVSPEFGFGQGFETFEGVRPSVFVNGTLLGKALFMSRLASLVGKPLGVGERLERGSPALHADLLSFLDRRRGDGRAAKPFFAYVHAMEPHLPYEPARGDAEAFGLPEGEPYSTPPSYNGMLPFVRTPAPPPDLLRNLVAQYDGEIRGWSRSFGDLVEELRKRDVLDDTVIVVCSDHGEEFHEHGGWTHGHSLHREVVQVPLVVRLPSSLGEKATASRGRRVGGVTTLLDVFPTLIELAGVRYPRGAEADRAGRSLVPQLMGVDGGPPASIVPLSRPILGEVTVSPVTLRSLRDGRWVLVVASEPLRSARALYDDVSDPKHRRDWSGDEGAVAAQYEARLEEFFRRLARIALTGRDREIDAETADLLRRLGYVGGK